METDERIRADTQADTPSSTTPMVVAEPQTGARRFVRPVLVVVLIVAGVVALYLSAASRADDGARVTVLPGLTERSSSTLPPTVAGLALTSQVTGQEAVDQIESLHISDVPVTWAEVGSYADGQASVWASRGPADGPSAAKLVERMAARIDEGGSGFGAPKPVEWASGVWRTTGFDQDHYFFAGPDYTVWWLSVEPSLGQAALTDLLGVVQS
jgi:hypothetical protein